MAEEPSFFYTFLDEAEDNLQTWESLCLSLDKSVEKGDLDALFRVAHNLKGSSKSVGCIEFGTFVHSVEDLITALKKGEITWNIAVSKALFKSHGVLNTWLQGLRTDPKFVPDTADVLCMLYTRIEPQKTEISGFTLFEDDPVPLPVAIPAAAPVAISVLVEKEAKTRSPSNDTIRISKSKIDSLQQLIGELTSARAVIAYAHKSKDYETKAFDDAQSLLYATVRDLQGVTLSLKTQSIEGLFQRLERVARDIGRDLDKQVEIRFEGEETEIDRVVIEKVTEPLVHVMRNAIDHGLEPMKIRIEKQKPEIGTITVSASSNASHVSIKVSDDGAGLDSKRIRQKAIEKGLIASDQALTLEESQALILLPGFSTADKLTNISGRGVGMDIVKTTVEEMGGQLHLSSVFGQGSSFELLIPVSLSIIDALIVSIDDKPYVVPLNSLSEVLELKSHSIKKASISERTIMVRNEVMPLHNLWDHLDHLEQRGISSQTLNQSDGDIALVAQSQGKSIAFCIDRIIGKQTVVVRPLMQSMEQQIGIIGTTTIASGLPALIISLGEFAQSHFSCSQGARAS